MKIAGRLLLKYVCKNCKSGNCNLCIDVFRALYTANPSLCRCGKKNHKEMKNGGSSN